MCIRDSDDEDTMHVVAKADKFGIQFYTLKDSTLGLLPTNGTVSNTTITIPSQNNNVYDLTGFGSINACLLYTSRCV